MKKYNTFIIGLLSIFIFISSCQEDTDRIVPVSNETYVTHIFGTVTDTDGNEIEGALVSFNDLTILTDEYGTYLFKDAIVDSRYNHLNVSKSGFFLNTRTFRGSESKMIRLKSTMLQAPFEQNIPSNAPSSIVKGSIAIEFDGKGMIIQDNNEKYEGEVEVAIQFLNPMDTKIGDVMPGDLSAVDDDGRLRLLESFGMVGVELRAKNGQRLQLAEESSAVLTMNISEELMAIAPDQIPLWHFDHASGLWIEEGSAVKAGNTYQGSVNHFSFWNFDVARTPVMLSGRLVDDNGVGIASTQVKIVRENENRGGSGLTDYEGYFNGPIEKGMSLELSVISPCTGDQVIYQQLVGPFEDDANLGDIILDIPNVEYLTVQGEFLNCDGEILQDGLLKINDLERPDYFPIIGGSIDKIFGICGLESIELEIIDRQELKKKSLGYFEVPGLASVEEVKVCDEPVNFASINSPTFDINLVMVDSISFAANGKNKSILAFDYSYELAVIEVKYVDNDESNIELGTHKILKMVCNWRVDENTFEIVLILDEGEITIEEVDYDERTVKGAYTFEATIDVLEQKHVFEGEFFSYF